MVMNENNTVNVRTKNALCYIPLAAFLIHFTETKKTSELKKHIKYWIVLFIWYAILNVILWIFLWAILLLIYLWTSWFLWYKAYNWEDITISFIDNFDNKPEKKKNNSSDKNKDEDDVLNF